MVAAEVKALSNQTAGSTDEINRLILEIQTATQASVDAVPIIGKHIQEVDNVAAAVAAAMEEQGAATREIARNVNVPRERRSKSPKRLNMSVATLAPSTRVLPMSGHRSWR